MAIREIAADMEETPSMSKITRILTGLARATSEFLAAKVDEESRGEQIAFSNWHETYHVGQLELLRQLAGKDDKVI